jgi:hypothetical protein
MGGRDQTKLGRDTTHDPCIYLKAGGKKFFLSTDIEIGMDMLIAFHNNN